MLCVFFGPFDTISDLDLFERIAFWTVAVTTVGSVIAHCLTIVIESRWFSKLHIAFRMLLGALIGAIPGASFMVAINLLFRPEHLNDLDFPSLWIKVTIMALLIAGLEHLFWIRFRSQSAERNYDLPGDVEPEPTQDHISRPRLFLRLPDRLREAQIISMSMQDHYVEITTTRGASMLLMRLSDAIDLLDGLAGAQTHRSHWAARAHAQQLSKKGRRHALSLSDGRKLPVSSSFITDVEQMLKEKEQA
ncbi:MAG: LytTR family DNA-binding domain-containing protein [Planktotalea sp.]|uniref:LytTR family DNA-binding domain-containing protein n=1 Tax=Planktotalea sp. TaxID=2029877 RepID=UPI003C71E981